MVSHVENNEHALGTERRLECGRDLFAETLLNLWFSRKHFDNARQRAEGGQILTRNVGHMGDPDEGHEVVFTQ